MVQRGPQTDRLVRPLDRLPFPEPLTESQRSGISTAQTFLQLVTPRSTLPFREALNDRTESGFAPH